MPRRVTEKRELHRRERPSQRAHPSDQRAVPLSSPGGLTLSEGGRWEGEHPDERPKDPRACTGQGSVDLPTTRLKKPCNTQCVGCAQKAGISRKPRWLWCLPTELESKLQKD